MGKWRLGVGVLTGLAVGATLGRRFPGRERKPRDGAWIRRPGVSLYRLKGSGDAA